MRFCWTFDTQFLGNRLFLIRNYRFVFSYGTLK